MTDTESTGAVAAVPPTSAPDVVEDWFRRHFFNLGAGITEEMYNRIHAAKDDLKTVLADFVRA